MDIWTWIIVYVVGLALLQLLVYRYLWNGEETMAAGQSPTARGDSGQREDRSDGSISRNDLLRNVYSNVWAEFDEPDHADAGGHERRCPHCGAVNTPDAAFTYCRQCVQPLG